MYDINWLLSSVAQASAAMIAIVGGLLVTRYVGLHAEQQAASRRLTDLNARSTNARRQMDADLREVKEVEAADLVNDERVFAAIVDADLALPVERVFPVTGDDPVDYVEEAVQGQLDAVTAQIRTAYRTLVPLIPDTVQQDDWADFRGTHPALPVHHAKAWAWVYGQVSGRKKSQAAKAGDPLTHIAFVTQQPYATEPPQIRVDNQLVRDMLTSRIAGAKKDAEEAELGAVLASKAYEATRQPEGFGLALRVLRTLALCGVVPPVLLMAFGGDWWYPWPSVAVTLLFFVGLGTLLRFLFVYASFLQQGGHSELPTTVLGLFSKDKEPSATSK
ncbi:hypothetical protein [Microbacterium sp. NPDC090003]|uniref:hypothetical protein n=1 Tax=Microbacterium sp. NPDC090003 TaxID=3364203 RepID=UPI003801B65B